jgi:MFS family permease
VYPKKYIMAVTFCFMAAGMLAFSSVHRYWVILPFLLLFPPGFGGSMVIRGALLREYFGRTSLGKMLGITMGTAAVGGVIGSTLAGYIYDAIGSYRPVWFIFCGMLMGAFFLVLRFKRVVNSPCAVIEDS